MNYYDDHIPNESTLDIISKTAFLTGVPERIFDNPHEPPQRAVFDTMRGDRSCRIVRNLCCLRTELAQKNKTIFDAMRGCLYSAVSFVDPVVVQSLSADGIRFSGKEIRDINLLTVEINRKLSDRINNCRDYFPAWLNWEYLKAIIVSPDWLTDTGVKTAAKLYYKWKQQLPYQIYIDWSPIPEEGNLFLNDRRFATRLYEMNNDYFTDLAKVSDCGEPVKDTIHSFLEEGQMAVLLVDYENSDPYKLCATLKGLDGSFLRKLQGIVLIDDVHTSSAWEIFDRYTDIPVEHIVVQRIKQEKSLVDPALISRACREFYQNRADSFIICSSDSDFWALVQALPTAKFLFLVQRNRFSASMKQALSGSGIHYAYIEDFNEGNSRDIQTAAILREVRGELEEIICINVKDVLEAALRRTRTMLTEKEQARFFQQYIKTIRLSVGDDGCVQMSFHQK